MTPELDYVGYSFAAALAETGASKENILRDTAFYAYTIGRNLTKEQIDYCCRIATIPDNAPLTFWKYVKESADCGYDFLTTTSFVGFGLEGYYRDCIKHIRCRELLMRIASDIKCENDETALSKEEAGLRVLYDFRKPDEFATPDIRRFVEAYKDCYEELGFDPFLNFSGIEFLEEGEAYDVELRLNINGMLLSSECYTPNGRLILAENDPVKNAGHKIY